ncbi:hypothetical protein KP509_16G072800 [Ceratopteris richardii]|uniref:Uncharacterized protein n=1 Tax=Ceratopteris richardii TaxID=49495 RepID=A0A8T2T1T6_CERRI|nr:hypothetical protein KP509_16G072800 [Ceratopteris richardii]
MLFARWKLRLSPFPVRSLVVARNRKNLPIPSYCAFSRSRTQPEHLSADNMALLSSTRTFLECRSLVAGSRIRHEPSIVTQRPGSNHRLIFSASVQETEEKHYVERTSAPSPYSRVSYFLAGSSRKIPIKSLTQEITTVPAEAAPADGAVSEITGSDAHTGQARMVSKNGPRGVRRVSFTPQKARELRRKMRETESYHDTMYHSAIATRLASPDD